MTGGKKWVLVITDEQHEWLTNVSDKTDLKGSDIVREMINNVMSDDEKFIASLANAQLKIKLQTINDKKLALEAEEKELKKQFKGERVAA